MKRHFFFIISVLFIFSACEKTISLDLDQAPELIIIEGLVTNEFKSHQIKISKTVPFDSNGTTPRVSGAIVTVIEGEKIFEFAETEPGIYQSKDAFAGEVGKTYSMNVEVEGQIYTAEEELFYVAPFEKLEYRIDPEEQADPDDENRFYEVLVFIKEPQETEDFYLIKFYRNGDIENENGEFVFVYDDVALGEDIESLPTPVYYALGDTARTEILSISRRAFRYYFDLNNNINNDGGMFSGQPANTSTNIEGGALGYFQVSSLSAAEIIIE